MEYQFASAGPALRIVALIFLFLFAIAVVAALVGIAALPGWIAKRRHHPQAAAVNICGWFGLPTGVFWVYANTWAYYRYDKSGGEANVNLIELADQIAHLEGSLTRLEHASRGEPS